MHINKELIKKAIKIQKHILSSSPYCTIYISELDEYSVKCHSTEIEDDYNAIICKSNGGSFKSHYDTLNRNMRSIGDKVDTFNKSPYTLKWISTSESYVDRKKLHIPDEFTGGSINNFLNDLGRFRGIIKEISPDLATKVKVTIWDDGTYKFSSYQSLPRETAETYLSQNASLDSNNNNNNIYHSVKYKWTNDYIKHNIVLGKLENNISRSKQKVEEYELRDTLDYIEEAKNKHLILRPD